MAQLATASAKSGAEAKVKDAIDNLRSAAQDLHYRRRRQEERRHKGRPRGSDRKSQEPCEVRKSFYRHTARQRGRAFDRCDNAS